MPTSATQTKTPSALKWLLNERAALEGELVRSKKSRDLLRGRIATQQAALDRHEAAVRLCEERLAALDVSVGLLHPEVGAARPAPVFAWQGKYGPRGRLSVFILEKLREAAPGAVVTNVLCAQVVQQFELDISTEPLRRRVRDSVKNILNRFATQGQVERLPVSLPHSRAGLWRLRQTSPLDELLALTRAQGAGHDPPVDAPGSQVDRQ